MDRLAARRLLTGPRALRRPAQPTRALPPRPQPARTVVSITQAGFWKSLVPKPLRKEERLADDPMIQRVKPKRLREWNPATFYIVIFLLIGSMAINMISLRQSFDAFMRQTDVRVGLLKEVVERLQRGEEVDVEKALGTGNAEKEADWADVLKEIEREEFTRKQKRERSRKPEQVARPEEPAAPAEDAVKTQQQQGTGMSSFF